MEEKKRPNMEDTIKSVGGDRRNGADILSGHAGGGRNDGGGHADDAGISFCNTIRQTVGRAGTGGRISGHQPFGPAAKVSAAGHGKNTGSNRRGGGLCPPPPMCRIRGSR